jgi:ADP-ribosylglycohydrolase
LVLVELAVGDAYGAGFEGADAAHVAAGNDLSRYVTNPAWPLVPGRYTDDTQMSIAIAEAIVDGVAWTPAALADKFVEVFKRDPRPGYTTWFHNFLTSVNSGEQFLAEITAASTKSGAAMRAAPIGVFPTVDEVSERAALQARITHDTPEGTNSARVAALMTHYVLYRKGGIADLATFLNRHVPGDWATPWRGPVDEQGPSCVRAAITAVRQSHGLSDLLRRCIDFTGDVDTVAAIALATAACSTELRQDLPSHLVDQLESGRYGRNYLTQLDQRLLTTVARRSD